MAKTSEVSARPDRRRAAAWGREVEETSQTFAPAGGCPGGGPRFGGPQRQDGGFRGPRSRPSNRFADRKAPLRLATRGSSSRQTVVRNWTAQNLEKWPVRAASRYSIFRQRIREVRWTTARSRVPLRPTSRHRHARIGWPRHGHRFHRRRRTWSHHGISNRQWQ